ncbi:MAG: extracellular solute-binding protein [Chloroflexi bacterium]|nr:extracellular solute-binding protein [Chloroflexota bacterium]
MSKKLLMTVGFLAIVMIGFSSCVAPVLPPAAPVTFSILYNERAATPLKKDWLILDEYKKRQNVILDVRLGDDAAYDKAITQAFESGDVPDIILKVWPKTIESYASAGKLLPFSDYENRMPNFMAYIKQHNLQGELDKLRLKNGKYYILPGYQRTIQVQQWIYRRDVFEKHGLKAPTTYDELFDALVLLKGIYPKATPITASWGGAHLFAMMGAGYGIPAGWAGTSYYDDAARRWRFSPATENYKALYSFLNRCYKAGILDPAIFTQSEADFTNKLVDGSALVTVTWVSSGFRTWNDKLKENGIPDGEWVPLPVPASTIGIRALPAVDPLRKGLAVSSRVTSEPDFEKLLKFLDWAVYSEEGMTLTTWGIEGMTFQNTSAGKVYLPTVKTPKNAGGTLDIAKEYGFDSMFNLNENEAFEDYKKPPEIVAFLERSLLANEAAKMNPPLPLDANAVEAARIINEKITPYVTESGKSFITGGLSMDKDWNSYLLELEKRGYKTLEDIWNAAWEQQKR